MRERSKMARLAGWIAALVAVVVSLAFPLGYFVISYQYMAGSLATEAEVNAGIVSGVISTNPQLWRYEESRLAGMLARRPRAGHGETRRIYDSKGRLVAESVNPLSPPILTRSFEVLDTGVPVGRIEISRSLRPLLRRTGLVALIGLACGGTLFLTFRLLPFRAVVHVERKLQKRNEELMVTEEELRKWSDVFFHTRMGVVIGPPYGQTLGMVNPAYAEMHGYAIDELVGRPVSEVYAPQCWDDLRENIRLVVESGHHIYESQHIRKDGTVFPVMVDASIVKGGDGKALYRIVSVQDITKRKEAEEALRRHQERLRLLIENALDVITVLGADGDIRFQSPSIERVVGYRPEELIGRNAFDFIHPDDRGRTVAAFSRAMEEPQTTLTLEYRFLHKDGSWRMLEGIGKKLPESGPEAGVVVNSRDITERRLAEEEIHRLNAELEQRVRERTAQLEAANKELESFSYSVSHDLRAPLRHIEGFCQIILEDCCDRLDPRGKGYLERVGVASRRMSQLIDDLLNLSRVSRGELSRQTVDLSAMARDIAEEYRQSQPERQVTFVIADTAMASGDPRLLRVVLDNLLGNAWKYTGKQEKATIEFGATEADGTTVWFVRDDGVGFDMAYGDKLFGTFQRLHGLEEFEGTGIGLATVKRIIHRHGGRVWGEGEVGKGATFRFTLG